MGITKDPVVFTNHLLLAIAHHTQKQRVRLEDLAAWSETDGSDTDFYCINKCLGLGQLHLTRL